MNEVLFRTRSAVMCGAGPRVGVSGMEGNGREWKGSLLKADSEVTVSRGLACFGIGLER